MRIIIMIFICCLFSCNQKQEKIITEKDRISNHTLSNKKIPYSKNKRYVKGQIYNDSIINFGGLQVNYGFGKYIFDKAQENYLIDSTVVKTKNIPVEEILFRPEDYLEDVIKISDFTYALVKSEGILSMGLLKKDKNYNWKCVDALEIEKTSDKSEYPSDLGNNMVFSYECKTDKGHFCCGVVVDKTNGSGKYEKVLKAYKFDLGNEKVIEIDLKKEKVECFPEIGDE